MSELDASGLQGRGGAGVVIDGCIRDFVHAQELEIGMEKDGLKRKEA